MNRRHFLQGLAGILAAGYAPAVFSSGVASGILMPVRKIALPLPAAPMGPCVTIYGEDQFGYLISETIQMNDYSLNRNFQTKNQFATLFSYTFSL